MKDERDNDIAYDPVPPPFVVGFIKSFLIFGLCLATAPIVSSAVGYLLNSEMFFFLPQTLFPFPSSFIQMSAATRNRIEIIIPLYWVILSLLFAGICGRRKFSVNVIAACMLIFAGGWLLTWLFRSFGIQIQFNGL
jgi:hypothetical protein